MYPSLCVEEEKGREDRQVVVDDAVSNQATALIPQVLFILGFEAQLAEIGIAHRPPQVVKILATIDSPLDIAAQRGGINVVQQIEALNDMVIFPQR